MINYHIIRVATDFRKCTPTFLYAAFNSEMVQRQVEREKGKGTREGVSTDTLLSFILPIPPIAEQERLSALIKAHNAVISNIKFQCAKLRALKRALMRDLVTGGTRVTALLGLVSAQERKCAVG